MACREHFLATHPGYPNEGVGAEEGDEGKIALNPVTWFVKSQKYFEEREKEKEKK